MNDATPKTLWPLAEQIAANLDGFTAHRAPVDYGLERDTRAYLRHEDGREIGLILGVGRYGLAPHHKVRVYGRYGMDNGRIVTPRDEKPPEINVSASKTPERIARDIERRFLGRYTEVFERCRERIEAARRHREEVREHARRTAERLGVNPDDVRYDQDGYTATLYVPNLPTIRIGDTWLEFKGSLPADLAARLVDAIAEHRSQ